MLLAVPAFLGLAVFGSYFLAKLALRPIDHITETAVSLGAGNLSRRITGIESRDEVGRLAGAFNGMLARLEDSFQREKQFTSDASHELRTPVSVIMAYAENLAAHAPDRETVEQAYAILTESRRMHSIIAQLLALTRGYEGKYQLSLEEINLKEMVSDVLAELTEEAAAGGITLIEQVPPPYSALRRPEPDDPAAAEPGGERDQVWKDRRHRRGQRAGTGRAYPSDHPGRRHRDRGKGPAPYF